MKVTYTMKLRVFSYAPSETFSCSISFILSFSMSFMEIEN
jgi:hypothetical protein